MNKKNLRIVKLKKTPDGGFFVQKKLSFFGLFPCWRIQEREYHPTYQYSHETLREAENTVKWILDGRKIDEDKKFIVIKDYDNEPS